MRRVGPAMAPPLQAGGLRPSLFDIHHGHLHVYTFHGWPQAAAKWGVMRLPEQRKGDNNL